MNSGSCARGPKGSGRLSDPPWLHAEVLSPLGDRLPLADPGESNPASAQARTFEMLPRPLGLTLKRLRGQGLRLAVARLSPLEDGKNLDQWLAGLVDQAFMAGGFAEGAYYLVYLQRRGQSDQEVETLLKAKLTKALQSGDQASLSASSTLMISIAHIEAQELVHEELALLYLAAAKEQRLVA